MEKSEVKALIELLDDPDQRVYESVRERLLSCGVEVIPHLEEVWECAYDSLIHQRIEEIIHFLQTEETRQRLKNWVKMGGTNLLSGALIVSRFQYPGMDEQKIREQLEKIRQDVWLEIHPNLTALEKIRVLNYIFFRVHKFKGDSKDFHSPKNSYINSVLETKKGNPLALGIIYQYLADSLHMPVLGVNLPEHFVLAYMNSRDEYTVEGEEILFYINPFSEGAIFSRKEIDDFLKQLNLSPEPEFYQPCSNIDMIRRMVNNLIIAYRKLNMLDKVSLYQWVLSELVKDE